VSGNRSTSEIHSQSTAIPEWITPALIAETKAVWRPYYAEDLTDEQAVALLIPVGVLYEVLFTGKDQDEEELEKTDDEEAVHCIGAGQ
jgi:hypothetical protein